MDYRLIFNPIITPTIVAVITMALLGTIVYRSGAFQRDRSTSFVKWLKVTIVATGKNLYSWKWSKSLLFWLVISAGTFSELAFLLASIWKSVNASQHSFILMFMDNLRSQQITYWADSAYIMLSVCILPLAAITSYRHIKVWLYTKKWVCSSAIWTVLYGLPTLTFLVIDIAVISNSDVTYVLPAFLVSARSIMAYTYGLVAIIYHYVGQPQEAERLKQKDDFISQLVEKIRLLTEKTEALNAEIEDQKAALVESKNQQRALKDAMQKSSDMALEAYGDECLQWLKSGVKTVLLDEINRFTGISKRKISNAITSGDLQVSPRNKDLILVSSLIEWLKGLPLPVNKPALHVVNG